ncbi:ABC transporter ATP-binding protein [Streptomyces sp. NBC_00873]|uniref:ABC transporter ATP-binding protein n=1 Tax=unclassified Streptomyces TaxID=2593676 RepID=UPI0022535C29|nr:MULTISPECIES: ABC transporter ATP-binding protein [unclassified Streptomyces]MCX4538946.1 ABC transporter ATP-binding protein [Streptomyces sp. NBC_01669]WSA04822.1 ABC transporter ATP-binding protein [Streptomyces sp. NBC_00841]WSY96082.1 ABC transporter ATP-binding protein [Streptomyces sp. NBC_00873]WTA42137.1 ABC transporter ATP-binding protein [Streptomyces sp. NBC_00842]
MLTADNLTVAYGRNTVVHGVSLSLSAGTAPDSAAESAGAGARGGVALIGESGSGKTTIARALLGLVKPSAGTVRFAEQDIHKLHRAARRDYRSRVQPVFQDGSEALNPRMTIGTSLREALRLRKDEGPSIEVLLESVGLDSQLAGRLPHQLSGGQRQRVVIARALAVDPALLILDEPTSALDVTVQARVLDLLEDLRTTAGLRYLLITHNLAVVPRLCETVHVLFAGRVIESGPASEVLASPAHPYTVALRDAVPRLGTTNSEGRSSATPPRTERTDTQAATSGCPFRHRCPAAFDRCATSTPALRPLTSVRSVACHAADGETGPHPDAPTV